MSLDLINNFFNNLKENDFVQNFINELSNHLKNNASNTSEIPVTSSTWNNLLADDLTLYNTKIISIYRNEMLSERNNILQDYAKSTQELGEMYYIYNTSTKEKDSYILCSCNPEKNSETITMQPKDLPQGSELGSVLRKQNNGFVLDMHATKIIEEKINNMILEKIEEQKKYLDDNRIDGHTYEVGEKYLGRIWLYDLNNNSNGEISGIEEIDFPQDLYETAKEGDLFVYKDGTYHRKKE